MILYNNLRCNRKFDQERYSHFNIFWLEFPGFFIAIYPEYIQYASGYTAVPKRSFAIDHGKISVIGRLNDLENYDPVQEKIERDKLLEKEDYN